MKGVILAGGRGTRLLPVTKVTNKHLLAVYNRPMIYYPLGTLIDAGVTEVLIVTGPEHAGHFLNLLGSGKDHGIRLSYEVQEEAGGIAQALGLAALAGLVIFPWRWFNSDIQFNKALHFLLAPSFGTALGNYFSDP